MLSKFKEQMKRQMRLKIGKKLKRASHNLKFTDSYQKRVNTLCTYHFIVDCSRVARISQRGRGALLEVWYYRKRT